MYEPWFFFVVAFAIRLGSCAAKYGLGRIHPREYLEYVHMGERFLQFGTLVSPLTYDAASNAPSAILPPAYSVLVAAVFSLFGVRSCTSILVLQLINTVASSLAVVIVYAITRKLAGSTAPIGGTVAARIAALVAAVNPCLFGYTWMIWDTSLFILGVCLVLWYVLPRGGERWVPHPRYCEGGGRKAGMSAAGIALTRQQESRSAAVANRESSARWVGFGVLLGALALLNPSFTLAYPVLVLWPLVRKHGWLTRKLVRPVGMCVLGWILAITPWTIRNYVQLGRVLYVRGGLPMEFWLGVCPEADLGGGDAFRSEFPLSNADAERHIAVMGDMAFIDECGQRAWAAIRNDPWRYARLVGIRTADYWTGAVFEHSTSGSGWPPNRSRAAATVFLSIEGAAILGLLILAIARRRIPSDVLWLLALAGTFSVLYCLTHVQLRYRAPTEPMMAIALGLLAATARSRFRAVL